MAGLENKSIKIFFDDMGKVLCKEGIYVSQDIAYTLVKTSKGTEAIPTSRIIRIEVKS